MGSPSADLEIRQAALPSPKFHPLPAIQIQESIALKSRDRGNNQHQRSFV
jgi:hypothetical protein